MPSSDDRTRRLAPALVPMVRARPGLAGTAARASPLAAAGLLDLPGPRGPVRPAVLGSGAVGAATGDDGVRGDRPDDLLRKLELPRHSRRAVRPHPARRRRPRPAAGGPRRVAPA